MSAMIGVVAIVGVAFAIVVCAVADFLEWLSR